MRHEEEPQIITTASPLLELETFTVRGDYHQMGCAYGARFKPQILRFVEMRLASAETYFADWGRGSVDQLLSVGAQCWEAAKSFHPEGAREHEGIASAVGISPERLYATTNMTDVRDVVLLPDVQPPSEDEGCTSALIPPAENHSGLYGQTWDLNPPDIEYIVGLHRLPDHGLETWTVTCAGCLTLVGMNENGISVGTTNLKTWRSRVGVGYLSVLHKAVSQQTWSAASEVCERAPVAGAHSYWIGGSAGGVEWERSPGEAFRRDTMSGAIGRANHCLFEPHQEREAVSPTPSSQSRFDRVSALVQDPEYHTVDGLKRLFGDRADGVNSINRYPEDQQGTTTNSVVITSPQERVMFACRGSADRGAWYRLEFDRHKSS
jgi:isopenicillin-N N-acyltransferase-like protein